MKFVSTLPFSRTVGTAAVLVNSEITESENIDNFCFPDCHTKTERIYFEFTFWTWKFRRKCSQKIMYPWNKMADPMRGNHGRCRAIRMQNDDYPSMLFVSTVYHFFVLPYYMPPPPLLSWSLSDGNTNSCAVGLIINNEDV
jgi:hypothetical protein